MKKNEKIESYIDSLYLSFENKFRDPQVIKNNFHIYLEYLKNNKIGTKKMPVLDIGCGRGEWLKELKKNKYIAFGIDNNNAMIAECKKNKLDTIKADLFTYLKKQKSDSLGAVTGFQIIEHLNFRELVILIAEVSRVLKKNGIVIFETPNPESLYVASFSFYLDPTHIHPIPPPTLEFLLTFQGFSEIEIIKLNPLNPKQYKLRKMFKDGFARFYMEQDYAVIARK